MTDDEMLNKIRLGYATTSAAGQSATAMAIFLQMKIYDELCAIRSLLETNEPELASEDFEIAEEVEEEDAA